MAELCVAGFRWEKEGSPRKPAFSRIIITTPGIFKKSNPDDIYAVFSAKARELDNPPELLLIPDTDAAIDKAIAYALKESIPVLGTGSFYLAGLIRDKIAGNNEYS